MKSLPQVELMWTTKQFKVDVLALLLIIEVKINFSLDLDNTGYQTIKMYWFLPASVYSSSSLLIIEVKINFSLGFDNTGYQTNKLQNFKKVEFWL